MKIALVMTTYYPEGEIGATRFENAKRVVKSLNQNLIPNDLCTLIVSDDSETELGRLHSQELLHFYKNKSLSVIGPNAGVGASINRALAFLNKWYTKEYAWIYMPDDLMLIKPFDLTQAVKLLNPSIGYDFVRLDLPHPNLLCKTKFQQNIGWWLDLDLRCEYSFATRPTLISSKFTERIGPFKEFASSYEVELDYSHRVSDQLLYSAGAISCNLGNAWCHLSSEAEAVGCRAINH